MDVQKGETYGEDKEWRCEQKNIVAPHKCVVDIGTLERKVAKHRIGNRNQDNRSKNDARRGAQPCRQYQAMAHEDA
jgi:hypothetical protein